MMTENDKGKTKREMEGERREREEEGRGGEKRLRGRGGSNMSGQSKLRTQTATKGSRMLGQQMEHQLKPAFQGSSVLQIQPVNKFLIPCSTPSLVWARSKAPGDCVLLCAGTVMSEGQAQPSSA